MEPSYILLIICAALVGIGLVLWAQAAGRRRKWGLVVWIPSIAIPILLGATLFGALPGHINGPDAGYVAMAAGPAAIAALVITAPFALLGLTALFLFPRRPAWNLGGALGGVAICGLAILGWQRSTTRTAEVLVLDESGHPVGGVEVSLGYFEYGLDHRMPGVRTDAKGLARFRLPNRAEWSAHAVTSDGVRCLVAIEQPTDVWLEHPEYRQRRNYWTHPRWGRLISRVDDYVDPAESRRLTIRLRSRTERLSPWVIERLRAKADAFRRGSPFFVEFPDIHHWAELLVIMPEILEVFRAHYAAKPDARNLPFLLDGFADALHGAGETLARMRQPAPDRETLDTYETLCAWAGTTADSPDSLAKVDAKLRALVDDLVATSKSCWKSHGPAGVGHLWDLNHPYIPELLRWMEREMPEKHFYGFLSIIGSCHAPPEVLTPFLDSPNRFVQVAVLQALQDQLPLDEFRTRIDQLSHPGERSSIQYEIDSLQQHVRWREDDVARKARR